MPVIRGAAYRYPGYLQAAPGDGEALSMADRFPDIPGAHIIPAAHRFPEHSHALIRDAYVILFVYQRDLIGPFNHP